MAAQVPQSFHNRPSSKQSIYFYQAQILLRVVLSMSALCLLEIDRSLAQDRLESERSSLGDQAAEYQPSESPAESESPSISELELLKEEELVLKEESASIARGMYPGKPQPISQAPSNVYVITDEDIRHSGAIDLPTVLRRVPGIDVMQLTGADFNVSARGDNQLRANKMLVLVDGRSIYLDSQGEVFWKNIPVTLPEIKRIEVLKGPAAALYGFNAFDGVINIITKSAAEMKGVTLQFGGGEYGTISSAAVVAGVQGKAGYRMSVGRDQTNSWDQRDSLAFRNHKFNGQLEYALRGDARITLQGGIVDANRYDGPVVDLTTVTQQPMQRYVSAVYDRPNFFLRAYWTGNNQPGTIGTNPLIANNLRFVDQTGTSALVLESNSYNIEGQHAVDLWTSNRLTYGVNYRHNEATGNFTAGHEDRVGLYLQDEWRLTQTLTAVGGLRYDMDTFINPTISPRFSLQWQPLENHSFRAGVSVGYRPPTLFETRTANFGCISPRIPFSPSLAPCQVGLTPFTGETRTTLNGNQNLAPEQIISYDAGYQGWFWKHRLRVRADVFFNHISDLISIATASQGANTFANGGTQAVIGQGGGAADIYGAEVGIEAQITTWLSGFANYTYQDIGQTYTSGNSAQTNRVARGAPKHKVNVGVRAEFENGLNGEALLHYVSSATYPIDSGFAGFVAFGAPPPPNATVGSYVLLNLRGAYKVWRERSTGREAEVAVTAFNALNDKHKEHPLGETIGSRVMGWLTLKY
jgi:iron complex outermembrane receptor protein